MNNQDQPLQIEPISQKNLSVQTLRGGGLQPSFTVCGGMNCVCFGSDDEE